MSLEYLPGRQPSQEDCFVRPRVLKPAGQLSQEAVPDEAVRRYRPFAHSEHTTCVAAVAATISCDPGGQVAASVHADAFEAILSQPVGQATHAAALVVLENVPATQFERWWFCCSVGEPVRFWPL